MVRVLISGKQVDEFEHDGDTDSMIRRAQDLCKDKIEGKEMKKVIFSPDRIINFVVKE